jgi:phage major head subunit gpT-like protein
MIVNTQFLEKGLKATFDVAYAEIQSDPYAALFDAVATTLPSNSASEKYGFLGDLPIVQEWLGDKIAGVMKDYGYTISNKSWYTAIDIDRDEIKDDQLGRIYPRVVNMAETVRAWKGELVAQMIRDSLVNLAYDGVAFFANSGAVRLNDNLVAGSGVDTIAHIQTDIQTNRAAMMKFVGDNGKLMNLMADTIVCSPEYEGIFLQATGAAPQFDGSGLPVFNPYSRWIKNVLVCPNLTDTNDWFLLCCNKSLKPFVYQSREDATLVLDDTQEKRNRKIIYSAEMRGNAGYGFPQMAIRVVNT